MKIAVNTRLLLKGKLEGIGWFAFESLKRITTQHPEHQFIFFFDRPYDAEFVFSDNITPVIISPPARHPFLYFIWFELCLTWKLRVLKPDVFLSPDGYLSLSTSVKSIAVFHDLNFEHYPQDLPVLERWYYRFFFPKFAKKAIRIATVSEFSKQDIVKQYNIASENIDVVYNGCNELFHSTEESEKSKTKEKYALGQDYFLFVGAQHPRKNIANLFRAFDSFKMKGDPVKLLIVGQKKWWTQEISTAFDAMQHKGEVIFTGRLEQEDLRNVIGAALAMTYVSYFEGFGIPVLEAMNCDVPVITSDITSMPEIAGDAALFTDPFSVSSIAGAMCKIYEDPLLRKSLIEKGRLRRQEFSWQKTADKLWACIEKTHKL